MNFISSAITVLKAMCVYASHLGAPAATGAVPCHPFVVYLKNRKLVTYCNPSFYEYRSTAVALEAKLCLSAMFTCCMSVFSVDILYFGAEKPENVDLKSQFVPQDAFHANKETLLIRKLGDNAD